MKPTHPVPGDMEIAPGYTVCDWKSLDLSTNQSQDWPKAIEIFETRIRRRFLDPADLLITHEVDKPKGMFGFAIMALDCLVIETLQGFREGKVSHRGESKHLFTSFLKELWTGDFKGECGGNDKADLFYDRCRCALHHSGQTDGELRLRRSGPTIRFETENRIVVNRTAFHEAVKCEFNRYLGDLTDRNDSTLRDNFRRKMNSICGLECES